jgi:hypothetical protein
MGQLFHISEAYVSRMWGIYFTSVERQMKRSFLVRRTMLFSEWNDGKKLSYKRS